MTHPAIDTAVISTIVLSMLGTLPGIAALFAVIWYCILIFDRLRYGPRTDRR